MSVTCPVNDTIGICNTLDSAGAGLGVFLQYIVLVLPGFLIILGIIGVILAIGYAIAGVIKKSVNGTKTR
jgi:F0F1-type ATP synthase assembly protein I